MSNFSFRIAQDKAEFRKQKVTVTNVAVATMNFLFGMCFGTFESDIGTWDFSLMLGILPLCGHSCVRSHVSPVTDCSDNCQCKHGPEKGPWIGFNYMS